MASKGWASCHQNWVDAMKKNRDRRTIAIVYTGFTRAPYRIWMLEDDRVIMRGTFRFSDLQHVVSAVDSIYRAAGITGYYATNMQ